MATGKRRQRSFGTAVVTAVVVVSVGVSVMAASSAPASQAQTGSNCVTVSGLTEETMTYHFIGASSTVPVQNVGESLIYYDNIYEGMTDKVVGHAVGFVSAVYKRPSDGHLMTQYYESVQLPDGTISDSGVNDRYVIFSGGVAHFNAVGTSGKYLGKSGNRDWQLIPPVAVPPKPDQRGRFTTVLCD